MWSFDLNGSNLLAYNLIMLELGFLLGFLVANKIKNTKHKKKAKENKSNKCLEDVLEDESLANTPLDDRGDYYE